MKPHIEIFITTNSMMEQSQELSSDLYPEHKEPPNRIKMGPTYLCNNKRY